MFLAGAHQPAARIVFRKPPLGVLVREHDIPVLVPALVAVIGAPEDRFFPVVRIGIQFLDRLRPLRERTVVIEEIIYEVRSSIAEGQTIAEPLSENDIFPGMVTQMISVGEATGALDTMLNKVADFYDKEVDAAVDALTSMLEPLLMLFLGGAIGGLVIAMYLPIFDMASAVA